MSENAQWVVRSYSKITGDMISESITLDSYEDAFKLRNEWAFSPNFSIGMTAKVENIFGGEGRLLQFLARLERLEKTVEQIKQS